MITYLTIGTVLPVSLWSQTRSTVRLLRGGSPLLHEIRDIELSQDLVLDERELLRKILHVGTCTSPHHCKRIVQVLAEVHSMQFSEDCTSLSAYCSEKWIDNTLKGASKALHTLVSVHVGEGKATVNGAYRDRRGKRLDHAF